MKKELARFSAIIGLWGLLACELDSGAGGPGNGPGTGPEITVNLLSTAGLDGYVRSDGNSGTMGGPAITGDLDAGAPAIGFRQFYSFDLSPLPAGSTVTSATLQLFQAAVGGTPYLDLGNVIVDHVDYGGALTGAAYGATALASNVGIISSDVTIASKTLVVTARVQADVAAVRTRSQFRVRFSTFDSNNDAGSDFAQFTDAEFLGTNVPMLVVKYRE
jgi:hypothetical protein